MFEPVWPNPDDVPSRSWYRGDLYKGETSGPPKWVPKVNDIAYDFEPNLTYYRVTYVDANGLSTLSQIDIADNNSGVSDEDVLLGSGPGTISESFRCYINTNTLPYKLALDDRKYMYSATATHYKVFRGTDISEDGEVISAWYNNAGVLVSENIPLDVVANIPGNVAIKAPRVGFSTVALADGEPVTVVVYDDVNGPVEISRFLVRNTNFVRSSSAELRYITGIRLKSPFLSLSDQSMVEVPVNVTLDTIHLKGIVTYSDGSTQEWPVDGTKFRVYGLGAYIPTQTGQTQPIDLVYNLSPDESTYAGVSVVDGTIMERYTVRTVEADGAYSVKLFGYPRWINGALGYQMEYYLYNLERDLYYYVTPYVELATNSPPFQPTLYNSLQNLVVAIDLASVSPQFSEYRHVQAIGVTLARRGDILEVPNWTIHHVVGQNPPYGANAVAEIQFINTNQWNLDIRCGAGSLEDWLRDIFYDTKPLYNTSTEAKAPTPTHFNVIFKNRTYEMAVEQWDNISVVINDYAQGELLLLQFFRRTATDDLQLGMSALPVHLI